MGARASRKGIDARVIHPVIPNQRLGQSMMRNLVGVVVVVGLAAGCSGGLPFLPGSSTSSSGGGEQPLTVATYLDALNDATCGFDDRCVNLRGRAFSSVGDPKSTLRLIRCYELTVSHLESETGGDQSIVRRRGPEPGPSQGVHTDDDFAELLYLALSQITPLIAELDNAKRRLVELEGLRKQMNSRSHRAVGWLMSSLRGARH